MIQFRRNSMISLTILLLFVLLITACGKKIENPLNWQVQDFNYTDENGSPVGLDTLKGKVWIADFMFTNCTTVCTPMTIHLADLQKQLKQQGLDVTLVSFSVDPVQDKPEVLKEFAASHHADLSNWHFLTGYSPEEIKNLSEKSFKSAVQMDPASGQVLHGTSFYLVDQTGKIVKRYSGTDQETDKQLIGDVQTLLQ